MTTPQLSLVIFDTHDIFTLAVADASDYGNATISSPTVEITVPDYSPITLPFAQKTITMYNSTSLKLACDPDNNCATVPLPDGIWKIKYSIAPAYKYYTEKTFIRVDRLQERLDEVYLKMDIAECNRELEFQDRKYLDTVQAFIDGAVAAANKCSTKLAMDFYRKADKGIKDFINHRCQLFDNGMSKC